MLSWLDLPDADLALLTGSPKAARVHVAFMSALQPEKLNEKLACGTWARVVAFRPTGGRIQCIISSKEEADFLACHAAPPGTSRPMHILWDQSLFC